MPGTSVQAGAAEVMAPAVVPEGLKGLPDRMAAFMAQQGFAEPTEIQRRFVGNLLHQQLIAYHVNDELASQSFPSLPHMIFRPPIEA